MKFEHWQQWAKEPQVAEPYNLERVKGNLPEMESTKQLVKMISKIYQPQMRILDVGCNVGHYLTGLRKKFPELNYTGVDAYEHYILQAKDAFANDPNAIFHVKDIFEPLYPNNPFDVVFNCNVLLHLPDFRIPVKNLLASTKKFCFIRTLLGDTSTIVKCTMTDKFDSDGNPTDYWYINTWKKEYFVNYIRGLGWDVEMIKDEFDPSSIQQEFDSIKVENKQDRATRIQDGRQVVENIVLNWMWVKITPV